MKHGIWPVMILAATLVTRLSAQNLSWSWSNPQPHGNDIVGMAWNGTLGVQVCELGRVYTSPDLVNWFSQNSQLTNDLEAVTFFGQRIIITGASGAIAYSDDGVNFTNCSVNSGGNWLVSVAASPNLVVAVGDNGVIYTSTNGATWYLQNPPPRLGDSWLTSVAYGNGIFVTTGDTGGPGGVSYIANSSDGINWTNQTPSNLSASDGNLEAVAWISSSGSRTVYPYTGFWAVSDTGAAFYSTNNGVIWNRFTFGNPSTNVLYAIAADNTTGLLAGDSEVRLGSAVGKQIAWPEQIGAALTSVPPWTYFAAVSATNGVYELAGYDGMLVQSYLTNGTYNWNTPYYSARDWLFQVTLASGLYVAVGDNVRIMTSDDGVDWSVEELPLTNSVNLTNTAFFCVGGTTNLLVAAGSQGSLAISPNFVVPVVATNNAGGLFTNNVSTMGVIWYSLSAPAGTTNDLAGVCTFSNKLYLAGGNGTMLTLNLPNWSSLNASNVDTLLGGRNWTTNNSTVTSDLSSMTVFTNSVLTNGIMVACGDLGKILTSTNGTNWNLVYSGVTTGLLRVRCANGRLLVLGENGTLLTSTNATTWAKISSGVTNWLNDAIMVSNTCYIVGNQGVVLASTNFTNWTNIGTITTKSLNGVATQNGQLVVVGFEGTILRSQILPVTTPVNFTEFAQSDGYNIFSVAGIVDQQFTLDSSTNLVNWVTGPLLNLIYSDGTLIFYQTLPVHLQPSQYYRCTLK